MIVIICVLCETVYAVIRQNDDFDNCLLFVGINSGVV